MMFAITSLQADWVIVKGDSEPEQTDAHYWDPKSIEKNGSFRKVWLLSNHNESQIGGYHSVKSLYEFDCNKERARSFTMLLYTDKMASGDVIGAQHDKLKEWSIYTPGSIFSRIANAVCAN